MACRRLRARRAIVERLLSCRGGRRLRSDSTALHHDRFAGTLDARDASRRCGCDERGEREQREVVLQPATANVGQGLAPGSSTRRGMDVQLGPVPVCPSRLRPQHHSEPSPRIAQA